MTTKSDKILTLALDRGATESESIAAFLKYRKMHLDNKCSSIEDEYDHLYRSELTIPKHANGAGFLIVLICSLGHIENLKYKFELVDEYLHKTTIILKAESNKENVEALEEMIDTIVESFNG